MLILLTGVNSAQTKIKLTAQEAAARFEEFVIANGYTDLPPTDDKSKLVEEAVNGGTDEATLRMRRNTLERKPYRVSQGNRFSKDGWTAVFLYKNSCKDCRKLTARVVYMDAAGENPRIEHQDFIFKRKGKS